MPTSNQRFVLLDGLRGVAALGVLSFHVVVITDYMQLDSLYLLVDFFFVLSGFVLLPSMPSRVSGIARSSSAFVSKRLVRFFPMVWAAVALSMLAYWAGQLYSEIHYGSFSPDMSRNKDMIFNAMMLMQIWVSTSMFMVIPLWSLSAEWFANLIYTPLTAIRWQLGIVAGIVGGYLMLNYGLNNDLDWIGQLGPIREWEALGRAMLGFGLGLLLRSQLHRLERFRHWSLLLISSALVVWIFTLNNDIGYDCTYWAAPAFTFFIWQVSGVSISESSRLGRFLSFLGAMSFGIYAFHQVVIQSLSFLLPDPGYFDADSVWAWHFIAKISFVAAVSFLLAWLTKRFIETPIQNGLRPAIKRLQFGKAAK